jgi:hypothetical protein
VIQNGTSFTGLEKALMAAVTALFAALGVLWKRVIQLSKSLIREKDARIKDSKAELERTRKAHDIAVSRKRKTGKAGR